MLQVMLDTNILFSALNFPSWCTLKTFAKLASCQTLISDYSIEELRRTTSKKFPKNISVIERFIASGSYILKKAPAPSQIPPKIKTLIRDPFDAPILACAINAPKRRYTCFC